jgi:transposase
MATISRGMCLGLIPFKGERKLGIRERSEGYIMNKQQRTYTKEFKQEAVRLLETSGKKIPEIARDLGIADSTLSEWKKQQKAHGHEAFPGSGHQVPLEEENR